MFDKFLDYFRYPSTYKGIVVLASLAGFTVAPALQETIMQVGTAVYGLITLLKSDADVVTKKK